MSNVDRAVLDRIRRNRAKRDPVLDLDNCHLTVLPEPVAQLTHLTALSLFNNELTTLPEWLGQLTHLTALNVDYNLLTTLPESLGRLSRLATLSANDNQLVGLPQSLRQLSGLRELYLGRNQLDRLPEWLGQLAQLTTLGVSENQLRTLPESLGQLTHLATLGVCNNYLTTLPESLGRLTELVTLNVYANQLTALPASIGQLERLETLDAHDNPIEIPPPEVVARGAASVRDYFRQLEAAQQDRLYEAKLLIVGWPGAGKTTLMRKIQDSGYSLRFDEPSTRGIEVNTWSFPLPGGQPFRVNIWDFGGQQIYHATHQFFLTKRSLYVLVADTRREDTDFHYWLNVVSLLSDDSPLLIVGNERDDRPLEIINEPALRGEFGNLKEVLATNLATNRNLARVVEEVKHHITQLPIVGSPLPNTWVRVRQVLEADARDAISLDEYLDLCRDNGFLRERDALQLSGYLHDLGVCLHFQDDPLLRKMVILKPEWGTAAVYRALDDPGVIRNLGRFTRDDLEHIWSEPRWERARDELLRLMIKFQLCYPLPESENAYIAPQLLAKDQPHYDWDASDNLHLRYTYDFMPKGILTRFIVATHPYIENQRCVWNSGVVLANRGARAEIVEHYPQREVHVRVVGGNRRDLMTIVHWELEKIHRSFARLKYYTHVPCNCALCRTRPVPFFFDLERLRGFLARRRSIQCQESGDMVNPRVLLDDFPQQSGSVRVEERASERPITVFYSYAHEDDDLRGELEKSLALLRRQGQISEWHDQLISAGADWSSETRTHLESAEIILLLVSSDFMVSDFCWDVQLRYAIERHAQGSARVIPIILRPCDWEGAPFHGLQPLPRDGKAITTWTNRDEAFLDVCRGIRRAVEQMRTVA